MFLGLRPSLLEPFLWAMVWKNCVQRLQPKISFFTWEAVMGKDFNLLINFIEGASPLLTYATSVTRVRKVRNSCCFIVLRLNVFVIADFPLWCCVVEPKVCVEYSLELEQVVIGKKHKKVWQSGPLSLV